MKVKIYPSLVVANNLIGSGKKMTPWFQHFFCWLQHLVVARSSPVVAVAVTGSSKIALPLQQSNIAVTTVDSVGTTLAAVDTALALSHKATGARAYGVGTGAQSVIPTVK